MYETLGTYHGCPCVHVWSVFQAHMMESYWVTLFLCGFPKGVLGPTQAVFSSGACTKLCRLGWGGCVHPHVCAGTPGSAQGCWLNWDPCGESFSRKFFSELWTLPHPALSLEIQSAEHHSREDDSQVIYLHPLALPLVTVVLLRFRAPLSIPAICAGCSSSLSASPLGSCVQLTSLV